MADQTIQKIDMESNETNELAQAITLLHADQITKYDSVDTFMPYNPIRRDEAAKMYVNFEKNTLGINDVVDDHKSCYFTDTHLWHSDLVDLIRESCLRGLFKGYVWSFMPTSSITNAQAVIVLIRMIKWEQVEPVDDHYATNYMTVAQDMGLLDGLAISARSYWDAPATRATIAKLLYRADPKK